ncbi:MAG TPA: hypothetical protein VHV29_07810 [Terriglobales bacterium]|jgi:hypothetical protein|nr:hypothetical protein [Terriglobales bacterium]
MEEIYRPDARDKSRLYVAVMQSVAMVPSVEVPRAAISRAMSAVEGL